MIWGSISQSEVICTVLLFFDSVLCLAYCHIWSIWVSYLIQESWDLIWPGKRGSSWWPYALTCSSRWPDKQRCYPHYKNYSVNVSSKGGAADWMGPASQIFRSMKTVWTHNQGLLIHESWRVLGSPRLAPLTCRCRCTSVLSEVLGCLKSLLCQRGKKSKIIWVCWIFLTLQLWRLLHRRRLWESAGGIRHASGPIPEKR